MPSGVINQLRHIEFLISANQPLALFFRHALVGGFAYLLFFCAVAMAVVLDLSAPWISAVSGFAFAMVSVLSYFLHRSFTYRSARRDHRSVAAYTVVILAGAIGASLTAYLAKFHTDGWLIVAWQVLFAGVWAIASNLLMKFIVFADT